MNEHNIKQNILEKIKGKEIDIKPKWHFVVQDLLFWVGTGISLVLASLAAGSFVFQSANASIIPPHIHLWFGIVRVAIIVIFVVFAVFHVMRTKKGYKRKHGYYAFFGLVIVFAIGSLFFATNLSGIFEKNLGRSGVTDRAIEYWSDPQTGLLAGELVSVDGLGHGSFEALNGDNYQVNLENLSDDQYDVFVDVLRVRMVGYYENDTYNPCAVVPWELRGASTEPHAIYNRLEDGNHIFRPLKTLMDDFRIQSERKSQIIRTNQCK